MAKSDEIPTTITVTQAPAWFPDQLLVWFNQIATFINGSQAVKNKPIMSGTTQIGTVQSLRVGPMVFVQGSIGRAGGTYVQVEGLPILPASNCFITASASGVIRSMGIEKDSKNIALLVGETALLFSGWYLGANSNK